MEEIFIPTLHTFAMNNIFTGSCGEFRFKIKPDIRMKTPKEVDFENSTVLAEYWHGLYIKHPLFAQSEIIHEKEKRSLDNFCFLC